MSPSIRARGKSFMPLNRLALTLLLSFIALLALVLVINLPAFDEDPSPELMAVLQPPELPDPRQNAWVALWGFGAAEGVDMFDAGLRLRQRHDETKAARGEHGFSEEDYIEILGDGDAGIIDLDQAWRSGYETCNFRSENDCMDKLGPQLDSLGSPDRLDLLTRRYRELIRLPFFSEGYLDSPEDDLPDYGIAVRVGKIALLRLAATDTPAFLSLLAEDTVFWHRVLADTNTLIAKMVAVAVLWRDTYLVSAYLDSTRAGTADYEVLRQVLAPLDADTLDISETWRYEARLGLLSVNSDLLSWWQGPFLQKTATDNQAIRDTWEPLMALSRLSPAELFAYTQEARGRGQLPMQCCSSASQVNIFSPGFFYNPAGKLLLTSELDLGTMNLEDYLERVYDLEGYMRLARLKAAMHQARSSDPRLFLDDPDLANPYTLEHMVLASDENTLSFECLGLGNVCSMGLP